MADQCQFCSKPSREMEVLVLDDVLAIALRPMMEAMIHRSQVAIAEFDELFGERA